LGQLQVVADTDPNSSTTSPQVATKTASFVYDVSGNLQQIDRLNSPDTYYGYDKANRVKSIIHDTDPGTSDIWHTFGYDNASRITGFTTFGQGGGIRGYVYDEADQLTATTGGLGQESYTYDAQGRRVKRAIDADGGTPTFSNEYLGRPDAMAFNRKEAEVVRHVQRAQI
jgi:YD repeat-containing protein